MCTQHKCCHLVYWHCEQLLKVAFSVNLVFPLSTKEDVRPNMAGGWKQRTKAETLGCTRCQKLLFHMVFLKSYGLERYIFRLKKYLYRKIKIKKKHCWWKMVFLSCLKFQQHSIFSLVFSLHAGCLYFHFKY